MTYPDAIRYLESFINYEKIPAYPYKESLKLGRVKDFLCEIGNPQHFIKTIHIAGTKGKGSTAAFTAYILREAGYKTGLYTSPHLFDFRERIRILEPWIKKPARDPEFEGMILEDSLLSLIERLRPKIESFNETSEFGPLSFFEVYTAIALLYFKEQNADFAVLETGLGGRLDATNAADSSVCAITPISYEHTDKLGNTLKEIAQEKAGIIKSQRLIVISAPQEPEAMDVIRNRCEETGAKLYEVNKDIFYEKSVKGFNVSGMRGRYPDLKLSLLGEHQLLNASVAVGIIEALRSLGVAIGIDSMRAGLYNTRWPGRCEILAENPLTILDGAQNIASAKALKKAIEGNFKYKRLILVLGISKDKDIKGICDELNGLADEVIVTKSNNPRASDPKTLAAHFPDKPVFITDNVKQAKIAAVGKARKKDLILATGSLFLVGEFRNA